jgi:nucleoside-diphosphate-sugar epimerase
MKSKKLLIIGGSGFFAKSILDYILNYNLFKSVKTVLLLSRGFNKIIISKKLKKKIKIKTISADISKLKKIPFADYVIYCVINHNYKEDYNAVCNYYNLAKKHHLKSKILFTSSGAVYGVQPKHVTKIKENYLEKYQKINFKDGYKEKYSNIKLKSENLFKQLGNKGLKVSIARCFSFVGPNLPQNSHYVIGNIINNILRNKNINIKANYRIIRSYMYSDDLVRWLLKILDNSNNQCPIFNVGSNNKISIHKVANLLAKKYCLKILSSKKFSKKIDNYIPNTDKAKRELNLVVNNTSLEAIQKTINFYLKNSVKKKEVKRARKI